MIFARPSKTASALMFTLARPRICATWERVPGLLASWTVSCLARGMACPPLRSFLLFPARSEEHAGEPEERVVEAIDDSLLEGNDAIVGDSDVLRADVGAATGDVAEARAELPADRWNSILRVERMHLQRGEADHESRPHEGL